MPLPTTKDWRRTKRKTNKFDDVYQNVAKTAPVVRLRGCTADLKLMFRCEASLYSVNYNKTQWWKWLHLKFLRLILKPSADYKHLTSLWVCLVNKSDRNYSRCVKKNHQYLWKEKNIPSSWGSCVISVGSCLVRHEWQWRLTHTAVGVLWCDDDGGKWPSNSSNTRYKHTTLHCRPHVLIARWQPVVHIDHKTN